MNDLYRPGGFSMMPPAVKNLLLINVIFFLATIVLQNRGVDMYGIMGLSWVESENFRPWQFITYMFMHGDFTHIFFNMFALWMFGYLLENFWGTKRFLVYYFITGVGAAIVQLLVNWYGFNQIHEAIEIYKSNPNVADFTAIVQKYFVGKVYVDVNETNAFISQWQMNQTDLSFVSASFGRLENLTQSAMSIPMVGASGAVFGILLAFGMMFPNQRIYIYFLFPIKAKYFVIAYGALEFFFGISGAQSGVAHFAHLGGMLFGLILILYWRNKYRFRR